MIGRRREATEPSPSELVRAVRQIQTDLRTFRRDLAPLVPHVGAIEEELHDLGAAVGRIERQISRGKPRAPKRHQR